MKERLIQLVEDVRNQRAAGKQEEEIFTDFKERLKAAIQKKRLTARDAVVEAMIEITDKGKLIDPSADKDINIWRWCWASFLELGDRWSADKVIEECYNSLLRLQQRNSERYHKGTPLQTRAEGLLHIGQWAKAKRLVILAHIEDMITGQRTAPAWQTLKGFGISDQDLALIEQETMSLYQNYIAKGQKLLYPEEVFQKVQYRVEFATLGELNRDIVYTNSEYLRRLLELVKAASGGNDASEKGKTLENLAQYLFSSIEGFNAEPSTRTGPYELDAIITNSSNHPFLRTLDTYIPVECKNWREPIGSPEVTQFIGKLSLFKCNTGIIVSKQGIKDETVNELRKDAYRRSNIYVLVFNVSDIHSIIQGRDLVSLLIEKFKELKFSIRM